ncbi:MAG TPA: hypothetical protein VMH87_03540 [Pseudomonadales bacterium]|nr:hypothetical protein [Pseudomonadales bacterium]
MKDAFEQVRQQIHEIRNIIGPVNLKLADMDHQIATSKAYLEEKVMTLESKLLATVFRLDKQDLKIAELLAGQQKMTERMKRLER